MEIRLILSLIFALLIVIFSAQNSASVGIKILFSEFNVSLAVIVLISTIIGAAIVMLMWTIKKIKLSKKIKEQAKKIDGLEKELEAYKCKCIEVAQGKDDSQSQEK